MKKNIINYNILNDKDSSLLVKEYNYCSLHREDIIRRAKKIYSIINNHTNINLEKRCCNFKLLEKKCEEYNNFNYNKIEIKRI